ncbi:XRE family transcriptional regulator [Hoeflea marina]|uniref:XRE family transcriptional regulator n=1 Tax=Hoeflea marina TaxID=274592 RepID=A0A317PFU3_9HYPH|nr:XRE family transcriptional regulator [Hoeflea marina]PWV97802.1 XRE family transcriptional regulator [Hoeflea marina]
MTDTPNSASMPDNGESSQSRRIGQRLKALRTERGMTISGLAAAAGISSGLISQIERGNSNPSIGTLEKLRHALGANVWEFREAPKPSTEPAFVRRATNRPKIVVGTYGFSKELLSPRNNNELRFMILTLPAGARSNETLNGPGDKGGYVLEGRVDLTVGDEVARLDPGDSFQFSSSIPHHLENTSAETARILWIISIREAHL